MKACIVVLALTSCAVINAQAQNCPNGIPSAGNPMCIPQDRPESPYYNGSSAYNQQSAHPETIVVKQFWADRWGTIAMDSSIGVVGVSKNQKNKTISETIAMTDCLNRGGKRCKIKISYKNQCVAIIAGDNDSSIQSAPTMSKATELGLKKCGLDDNNCRVYYSECSMSQIEQK